MDNDSIWQEKIDASYWRRSLIRREQHKLEYEIYAEEQRLSKEKFIRWKKNWYKQRATNKLKTFYFIYCYL